MRLEKIDHLKLLKITGDDASTFLQGQLTNNIEEIGNRWQLNGYCNPKGRLLALLTLWKSKNDTFALIDSSLIESTINRLKMYVLRSDVKIEEVPNSSVLSCFAKQEQQEFKNMSSGDVKSLTTSSFALSFGQRFIIADLSNSLAHETSTSSTHKWLAADILDGLPRVSANTTELFIPQMLNLDVLQGISFKKGCYTGQEIIARMRYLGKLKQRMFLCQSTSQDSDNMVGQQVFADSRAVGTVVSVSESSNAMLAVLRLDAVEQNSSLSTKNGDQVLVVDEQPYSFTED